MPCAALCTSSSDEKPAANPLLSSSTRRPTLPWHALRSVDKAPRNPPEKLASPTSAGTRNRWSGAYTPARGARLTSGRSEVFTFGAELPEQALIGGLPTP